MDTIQRQYIPPPNDLFSTTIYPELPQESAHALLAAYRSHPTICNEWTRETNEKPLTSDHFSSSMNTISDGSYPTFSLPQHLETIPELPSHSLPPSSSSSIPPSSMFTPLSPGEQRKRKGGSDQPYSNQTSSEDGGYSRRKEQPDQGRKSRLKQTTKKSRSEVW